MSKFPIGLATGVEDKIPKEKSEILTGQKSLNQIYNHCYQFLHFNYVSVSIDNVLFQFPGHQPVSFGPNSTNI